MRLLSQASRLASKQAIICKRIKHCQIETIMVANSDTESGKVRLIRQEVSVSEGRCQFRGRLFMSSGIEGFHDSSESEPGFFPVSVCVDGYPKSLRQKVYISQCSKSPSNKYWPILHREERYPWVSVMVCGLIEYLICAVP